MGRASSHARVAAGPRSHRRASAHVHARGRKHPGTGRPQRLRGRQPAGATTVVRFGPLAPEGPKDRFSVFALHHREHVPQPDTLLVEPVRLPPSSSV
jgi:hypothetical protein